MSSTTEITQQTSRSFTGAASPAPFFAAGVLMYLMHRFGPTPATWLLLGVSWLLARDQLHVQVAAAEGSVKGPLSFLVSLGMVTVFYLVVLAWRWEGLRPALVAEGLYGTALEEGVRHRMSVWKADRRREAQAADLAAVASRMTGAWLTAEHTQATDAPF
ncbi:hypothetical protein ABZZ17_20375 [Streptomyces sp. NPDC006512]|uniref:hypothetical protein n=1 Tax=Streptomyces sp. NPDC006512 TaxID=3154307 RepID=UPI00339F4142